jgi:hypothetical protein
MKPVIFLRIASVLTFIHAVLHTIGGVFGKADPGPASVAVDAMKANQFLLMGNVRSYWDFYIGMGLCVTIFLTFESVVLWQLGSMARTNAVILRPVLAAFALEFAALTVNSWRYFFLGPVITEILIALCIAAAIATARRAETA